MAPGILQESKIPAGHEKPIHHDLKLTSLLAEGRNFKIQLWDPCGSRVSLHYFSVHVLRRKKNSGQKSQQYSFSSGNTSLSLSFHQTLAQLFLPLSTLGKGNTAEYMWCEPGCLNGESSLHNTYLLI